MLTQLEGEPAAKFRLADSSEVEHLAPHLTMRTGYQTLKVNTQNEPFLQV